MHIGSIQNRSTSQPLLASKNANQANKPNQTVVLDSFQAQHHTEMQFVPPKLNAVLESANKPYYDEPADTKAKAEYYSEIDLNQDPKTLFESLNKLMRRTHRETLAFKPRKYLHPWVDLRPNLRLQSIYSDEPVKTDDPINVNKRRDFTQKHRIKVAGRMRANGVRGPRRWKNKKTDFYDQAQKWGQVLLEGGANSLDIAEKIAMIEGYKHYNAEHSVPQFVFDREKKAKGDLHHLFTCEARANSVRSHFRFGEVPETEENRKGEGWVNKATEQFEPKNGKGEVARATLYFLMRYPGKLGDKPGEYTKEDVATLVNWSKEDPVGLYELHRNQAIQEIQGNRNPLIDFPELVEKVDFTEGLGAWAKEQPDGITLT